MANDFGITRDDAVAELQYQVDEAINFMWSEFEDNWAKAERYYAGGCDLPTEEGRSNAVKTEVRDVIRGLMPNLMRVLYQSRKPVEYEPSDITHAAFVDQQALFVHQRFKASGGYKILYNAVMQAAKLKVGPIKVWFEEDPMPEYVEMTALTEDEVEELKQMPDMEVEDVTEHPKLGEEGFFNVKARRYFHFGKLHIEDFPVYEFFVSRNATDLESAKVHGHHRLITVAEAIEMGLEYDNWADLQATGPEEKHSANSSRARRGYSTDSSDDESDDLLQTEILLTEVYCKFDLNGDGVEERYCFYLGGSAYKYIDHYEVEDYCIDLVCLDPQPYTVMGRSIADLLFEKQDNESSILRAITDNAHMANNPRYAGDPNNTDFADLMNNAIGAPVKTRGTPDIQVIDIPFTGGNLLPFLQYLEQDTEERVGITKASQGLDPDALQSTDKDAVRNTIQLAQGQVELMARNAVETGLIGIFKKFLKLSQRHLNRYQIIKTRGMLVNVDLAMFDADLAAEPNVGLGTASHDEKLQTLNFVMQKQQEIIGTFGMDNPFTSLSQLYNTIEDIVDLGGLKDPGRYFKVVTEEMERQIVEGQRADAEAQANNQPPPPMDPGVALLESEKIKAQVAMAREQGSQQVKMYEVNVDAELEQQKLELDRRRIDETHDLQRDELAQKRIIELRKISAERLDAKIKREQEANNAKPSGGDGATSGTRSAS